jgi:hypothetical protein
LKERVLFTIYRRDVACEFKDGVGI